MGNYDALWTRTSGIQTITAAALENYGKRLQWRGPKGEILHDCCADGTLTKRVLLPYVDRHVAKILATDRFPDTIALAQQENQDDKIEYQVFDVMSDDISGMEGRFGHIFSICVGQWLVPQSVLLEKYRRMLKPKGQLFIVVLADTPVQQSFHSLAQEEKWKHILANQTVFAAYSSDPVAYFKTLLDDAGFDTNVTASVSSSMPMENFSDMINLLWNMYYTYWSEIPPGLRKAFLEENLNKTLEQSTPLDVPNKYDFPYSCVVSVATNK